MSSETPGSRRRESRARPSSASSPTWQRLRGTGRRLGKKGRAVLVGAAGAAGLALLTGFFGLLGGRIFPGVVDVVVPSPPPPPPLSVSVLEAGAFVPATLLGEGAPYLVPTGSARPQDVPDSALDDWNVYREWVLTHGGEAAAETAFRLDLRAATPEPVIIHGLRVQIVESAAGTARGWFRDPEPGCGLEPVRYAEVNFDSAQKRVTWWDMDGESSTRPPTLSITNKDTETIELKVTTQRRDVSFKIFVLYNAPGGAGGTSGQ